MLELECPRNAVLDLFIAPAGTGGGTLLLLKQSRGAANLSGPVVRALQLGHPCSFLAIWIGVDFSQPWIHPTLSACR